MLFTYKNVVSDGQGNQVTVFQGFPIEDVLDFEFISFYDEATEKSQERMLVRLKSQVLSITESPKYNKNNVLVRVEKQEKLIPVTHTINFSEDIERFLTLGVENTSEFGYMLTQMHKTNVIPKEENKEIENRVEEPVLEEV